MTSPEPTIPPQDPPPRRLTRSSTDQVLGGVGGGLGRYFGVDPILFRIGFVVVALAGGAGLLAYFALWFLVPDENGQGVKRPPAGRLALIVAGGLLLCLLFGVLGLGGDLFMWPGFLGLLLLGVLVAAVFAADRDGDVGSRLLRAMLVVLAVFAAAVAGVSAAVGAAFGGGAVVAGIVIVLGLGLVAGAFGRGRRWLLIPALVLAVPATVVQAADLRVEGGVGEREYLPLSAADLEPVYKLGAGELTIDMTHFDFTSGRTDLRVDMGMGAIEVIVPEHVCVSSRAQVGAGVAEVFGHENGDIDLDWSQRPRSQGDAPELFVDAELDFGAIAVRHPGEPAWDHDEDDWGHDDDDTRAVGQAACR